MAKPSLEGMMRAKEATTAPVEVAEATQPLRPRVARKVVPLVTPNADVGVAPEIERVTLYLSKPVYRFIKQTALDHDIKPHDVLMQGVELVLAKYGKKPSDFGR